MGGACVTRFSYDSSQVTDHESVSGRVRSDTWIQGAIMFKKSLTTLLIASSFAVAACNTVRGAGQDLESAANCTENAIKTGACR